MSIQLNEVEQLVATTGASESEQRLRRIRGRVESIAADVHRISHNLHPSALLQAGLVASLHALCRDFSEHIHVSVRFTSGFVPPVRSQDIALALYRVTQECLTNVARHSGAARAEVALARRARALHLTITDDGVGIEMPKLLQTSGGLGLISIRERVRNVGGEVTLTSAPGRGTKVTVRVPLAVENST